MGRKHAIISMDVEDWYHLDYYQGQELDREYTMLDGFIRYIDLLDQYALKTTFFVLSELIEKSGEHVLYAANRGHEIACHGKTHIRPILLEVDTFYEEILEAKQKLSKLIGKEVCGYRAPCYSIDRARYEAVIKAGYKYDSSIISFNSHPLYGEVDLSDFTQSSKGIYHKEGFFEFEISTQKFMNHNIPVSGGGYIRMLPWFLMKKLLSDYLKNSELYVLYIHPFELSQLNMPNVQGSSFLNNLRARQGRSTVATKIEKVLLMLQKNDFEIRTFSEVIEIIEQHKER